MDAVLEKLLESPKLALYLRQIEDVLEREKAARQKFHHDLRDDQKAEFINGEVVMHSPVKKWHNDCGRRLLTLLSTYVQKYSLGFVGYEKILIRLTRNDYEPDLCFSRRNARVLSHLNRCFSLPLTLWWKFYQTAPRRMTVTQSLRTTRRTV
jgi:Uma2 family endonuclease